MKTLNLKSTSWTARNFIFGLGQEIIGRLSFQSGFRYKASYEEKNLSYQFASPSFWGSSIDVLSSGKKIATLKQKWFKDYITLATGETFTFRSSFGGRKQWWATAQGKEIVQFTSPTFNSLGRSTITIDDDLSTDTSTLLMSSGIVVRQLRVQRVLLFVVLIPVISRLF